MRIENGDRHQIVIEWLFYLSFAHALYLSFSLFLFSFSGWCLFSLYFSVSPSPEWRDANRFRLLVRSILVFFVRSHRLPFSSWFHLSEYTLRHLYSFYFSSWFCLRFSFLFSSVFLCLWPPLSLLLSLVRCFNQSRWLGHRCRLSSLVFYTQFPDDDYPCCEFVTSLIRGPNLDRYHKYDTVVSFIWSFDFFFRFFMIMCNPHPEST